MSDKKQAVPAEEEHSPLCRVMKNLYPKKEPTEAKTCAEMTHDEILIGKWVPLEVYQKLLMDANLINDAHDKARKQIQGFETENELLETDNKALKQDFSNQIKIRAKVEKELAETKKGLAKLQNYKRKILSSQNSQELYKNSGVGFSEE